MRQRFCGGCGEKIIDGTICKCKKTRINTGNFKRDIILDSYRWKKKRKYIKQRDGHLCQRCLIKYNIINSDDLQAHHIKSRVDFPELTWDDDNLICVCGTCNRQLGTTNELDFKWDINNKDFNL